MLCGSDSKEIIGAVPYFRQLVVGFPPRRPGFEPKSGHVGFLVNKVTLRQVFPEYFGFLYQFPFHRTLHTHHHIWSGAGTTDQTVTAVPSRLSLSSSQEIKTHGGVIKLISYVHPSTLKMVAIQFSETRLHWFISHKSVYFIEGHVYFRCHVFLNYAPHRKMLQIKVTRVQDV
jgi:hypothetical protein